MQKAGVKLAYRARKEFEVLESKLGKGLVVAAAVTGICCLALAGRPTRRSNSGALPESVLRQKIVNFFRAKYTLPATDSITAGPLESSQNPAYYECLVTISSGTKSQRLPLSISKTGRYLGFTPMFYLSGDANVDIITDTRTFYKLPPASNVAVGPFQSSPVPNFLQVPITVESGGQRKQGSFFVTADKRYAVLGAVYVLRSPGEIERMINTENQPYSGGPEAPVTIVEYADLECPTCARLQPFLENQLLPRYGNQVKLVYKEFPLPMHPWSRKAAVANQCAYQIDPSAYARYRTAIFAHQNEINFANVRDQLLQLGDQAGIDRLKLAACLDSDASLPRIEADMREGERLQVDSTPTCFINGRIVVGLESPEAYYNAIAEALKPARSR
jgi:protein-disulfide isomerase